MSSTSPAVRSLEKLDNYVRESHSSIRILCAQFDTSGDGALSASELQVALKVAVGVEYTSKDVEELIALADTDGTGAVELDEFKAICRGQV